MQRTKNQPGNSTQASTWTTFVRLARPALLAMLFVVGGVACGSAANVDPTPVQTFKITPAAKTTVPGSAVAPTTAAIASPAAPGAATTLVLVGQDSKFDKTALAASAGPITIKFSNKDGGIPHNIHVFEGTDAKGKSAGQTDLVPGPIEQELKLDLTAGEYYYHCDVHPTTMKGTLTVR